MSILDKRETAAETKFAKDEEQAFARNARLRKLLALWAAGEMRMDSEQAESYAGALTLDYFNIPSLIEKIAADFAEAGIAISNEDILDEKDRLEHQLSSR